MTIQKELAAAKKQIDELSYLVSFQRQLIAQDQDSIRFRERLIEEYFNGVGYLKGEFLGGCLTLEDFNELQESIEDLKR